MNEIDNPFNLEEEDLDWYDEELLEFVREETAEIESITELLDQDILYLYELWEEYTEQLDGEEEVVEVEPEDFHEYALKSAAEDEQDISISVEDMVLLIQLQQEFDVSLEEDDDE
ncbi:hypothetical protein [Porphyromonas levii]|uniref:Uncharacterized protein n=1 Tax=Porphyromonas levii TaxID=28114 RepID=A0A4Y8WM17_9PORP|nr:hypothetical protein [Porphyromonas levii]MBR8703491.1 hypothetical protein [Porphyromonas levii]MBR8713692.1 hypothetical protein [Porphyromonas levii]MBR8715699.1 hypothetical protein [Porphyromonas levii]MBR8728253.1 hypothetical protein [Porphyromonas levii]MBR8730044.1 hypothetical protein [Porphyromonas levii]